MEETHTLILEYHTVGVSVLVLLEEVVFTTVHQHVVTLIYSDRKVVSHDI